MTLINDLDYRYAWRWLLPLRNRNWIALIGFSEPERAFWRLALPGSVITEDWAKATVWLIQDQPLCDLAHYEAAPVHTVCIIGSRSMVATWRNGLAGRFAAVHDYALLPPHRPRVVIPLGVSDWTLHALALHRPGRPLARLAVSLLSLLARIGFDRTLRTRMLCIASRANAMPQGARQAGLDLNRSDAPQTFALYLGNPNGHRKTVILPLGGSAQILLKSGESPKAKAALHNEAATLKMLSQTALAPQTPALLNVVECDDALTLYQEYRARHVVSQARLEQAAVAFLSELSRLERRQRPLAEVLAQEPFLTSAAARTAGQTAYAAIREYLDTLAAAGFTVWGHRSHGDFAPWNCAWTNQGFFVFDWEESREWDVALGDAFYYVFASVLYIQRGADMQKTLHAALHWAKQVASMANMAYLDVRVYLALWLISRVEQTEFYNLLVLLNQSWR